MKIGPKYKIARKLGAGIFAKTQTPKFAISAAKKKIKIGKHGIRPKSEYGLQLQDKQRIKYTYGINERQLENYVKAGNLYQKLELRLDNVVFRVGLAPSRTAARQIVTHGHIMVNGRRVNVPSYGLKKGDVLTVRAGSREKGPFKNLEERTKGYQLPAWLTFDISKLEINVLEVPLDEGADTSLNFGAVVEFYSRV